MARRKITEPSDIADLADGLPELTEQQMDWVRGRLSGLSASDAYRQAYDCAKASPRTIWAEASRINTNPNVAAWLAAARMACLDTGRVTLEGHCAELARLKEIALSTGNVGAAVQAEQIRGKASGLHIERFEDVTPTDPLLILEQMARQSPAGAAAARALAAEHGITLELTANEPQTAGV